MVDQKTHRYLGSITREMPMKTDVQVHGRAAKGVVTGGLVSLAERHLDRFGADVFSVSIRLTDMNGPRGGRDMLASVTVHGPRIGTVTIEDLHESPTVAVAHALERMEQVVQRDLDRLRSVRRLRTNPFLGVPGFSR
jgi:hypothetical protein